MPCPPTLILVTQPINLLYRHLAKQGFDTWHKWTSIWMALWIYIIGQFLTTQHHQKSHSMISRRFCLLKSGTLSISRGTLIQDYIHIKDFVKYKCKLDLKQLSKPPQCTIIVAYRTSNHRLAIEFGWWPTIPISRDNI